MDTPTTRMHARSFSLFGTGTSMKGGGVNMKIYYPRLLLVFFMSLNTRLLLRKLS
jgi:hypothetical protein